MISVRDVGKAETLESDTPGSNSDEARFGHKANQEHSAKEQLWHSKVTLINKIKMCFYFINRRHFFLFY